MITVYGADGSAVISERKDYYEKKFGNEEGFHISEISFCQGRQCPHNGWVCACLVFHYLVFPSQIPKVGYSVWLMVMFQLLDNGVALI